MTIVRGPEAQSILQFDDGTCESGLGAGITVTSIVDFDVPTQCIQAGLDIVGLTAYLDATPPEGTLYYTVVGVDGVGNLSEFSNIESATYDETPPSFEVVYDLNPPFGVETIDFTLTVDEPLLAGPAIVIAPAGTTIPNLIELTEVDATTFTGSYEITADTPSGIATVASRCGHHVLKKFGDLAATGADDRAAFRFVIHAPIIMSALQSGLLWQDIDFRLELPLSQGRRIAGISRSRESSCPIISLKTSTSSAF